jgi:hypothetical protein
MRYLLSILATIFTAFVLISCVSKSQAPTLETFFQSIPDSIQTEIPNGEISDLNSFKHGEINYAKKFTGKTYNFLMYLAVTDKKNNQHIHEIRLQQILTSHYDLKVLITQDSNGFITHSEFCYYTSKNKSSGFASCQSFNFYDLQPDQQKKIMMIMNRNNTTPKILFTVNDLAKNQKNIQYQKIFLLPFSKNRL